MNDVTWRDLLASHVGFSSSNEQGLLYTSGEGPLSERWSLRSGGIYDRSGDAPASGPGKSIKISQQYALSGRCVGRGLKTAFLYDRQ